MLGREVLLPATFIAKPPEEPIPSTVQFVTDLREYIRAAYSKVRVAYTFSTVADLWHVQVCDLRCFCRFK